MDLPAVKETISRWSSPPGPGEDASPAHRAARAVFRVIFILATEFERDAITLRASALTYTVILSLVPVLAMGTAVLKGLGAGDQMRKAAYAFIDQMEAEQPPPVSGEDHGEQVTLTGHLRRATDTVFDYVNKTNFATLGILGVVGMLFTVVSLMSNIEQAMNAIWQASSQRPLGRKVMDYLALMILLPIAINVGLAAMTTLQSPRLLEILHHFIPLKGLGTLLLQAFTLAIIIGTFTILYRFLPNTHIPFFPAMIGGVVGGAGWLLLQAVYIKLQVGVARYNAIYGSFATLPLFLVWIYAGWVVFLSGAEIAFAVRYLRHYSAEMSKTKPVTELALALDILASLYRDFGQRRATGVEGLSNRLYQGRAAVEVVLEKLTEAGLIRELDREEGTFVPAAPASRVRLNEVAEIILGKETPETQGGQLAKEAMEALRLKWSPRDLGELLEGTGQSAQGERTTA